MQQGQSFTNQNQQQDRVTASNPYNKTPEQLMREALDNNLSPEDQLKSEWIIKAKQLNPTYNQQQLSNLYDQNIANKSPQRNLPSLHDQLIGLEAMYHEINHRVGPDPNVGTIKDPDTSNYGFDKSDKVASIGDLMAITIGGKVGIEKAGAGIYQFALHVLPKINYSDATPEELASAEKHGIIVDPITKEEDRQKETDYFLNSFKQRLQKDKLYQQALIQHPSMTAAGEFSGQILPYLTTAPIGGIEAAGEDALSSIFDYLGENGLTKSLTNRATTNGAMRIIGKVGQLTAKYGPKAAVGSALAASTYDPSGQAFNAQAKMGAILGLSLPFGGKLISKLSSPFVNKIAEISQQYGINLPLYPKLEKVLAKVPFGGYGNVISRRYQQVSDLGLSIANEMKGNFGEGFDYSKYFHDNLINSLEENKAKESDYYDKINNIVKNQTDKTVYLNNMRQVIADELKNISNQQPVIRDQNQKLINDLNKYSSVENDDYDSINNIKKAIGHDWAVAKNDVNTTPLHKYVLGKLYDSVKQDMSDYGQRMGGQINNLHLEANKLYQEKILPFIKGGNYNKYVAPNYDTDKFIKDFLKPNMPTNTANFLDLMSDDRKEQSLVAARASIITSALKEASETDKNDELIGINPMKFVKYALRYGKVNDIVFEPKQQGALEGYAKLSRYIKAISPSSLRPSKITGSLGIKEALGTSGLFWHPHIMIPLLSSGAVVTRLLTTESGQNALIKFSKLAGRVSPEQANPIIKNLFKLALISTGAQAAGAL